MRRAAKRDGNEREIIEALRGVGASVSMVSAPGLADLLVGFRGVTYLLEVKARKGKLTPDQIDFKNRWDGGVLTVVRSVDDALKVIGAVS